MNLEFKTKNLSFKFGKTEETKATPEPVSIKIPEKEYTYAPLKTALLPTPAQLRQAVISAESDPRPMMDVLRKLAIADMHLFGVTETRADALLGYDYEVVPGHGLEGNEDEKKKCDEINNHLTKTNFDDALKNCINGIVYGHSVTVPHWLLDSSNKYYPQFESLDFIHFAPRKNKLNMIVDKNDKEFFLTIGQNASGLLSDHDADSIALHLSNSSGLRWLPLPEDGILIMQYNPFKGLLNNYLGGLMRPALYLTLLKHYNLLDWAKFNELFGMPLRVGKFDPLLSGEEAINILKTAVKNLGADAAAVIDKTTEIHFENASSGSGQGRFTYEGFAEYIESKQSILILGQTLTTEITSKFGSRAVGEVHNLVRMDKLYADIIRVQKLITQQVVQKEYFYNYGPAPNNAYPKFKIITDEYKDLQLMSGVIDDLSRSGLQISKSWAYDFFGIKEPKDEEDKFGGNNNLFNIPT